MLVLPRINKSDLISTIAYKLSRHINYLKIVNGK